MKTQPTTNPIRLYGSAVGLVVGILAPMVTSFLVEGDVRSLIYLSICTGPLGAILGAYVAVFWKTTGLERKKLTDSLFPKLGGVVGAILGFWIPAILVFTLLAPVAIESIAPGIIYGGCAGVLFAPLGAASGVYLAKQLRKIRSEKESPT